jgi:hypothetical protein
MVNVIRACGWGCLLVDLDDRGFGGEREAGDGGRDVRPPDAGRVGPGFRRL